MRVVPTTSLPHSALFDAIPGEGFDPDDAGLLIFSGQDAPGPRVNRWWAPLLMVVIGAVMGVLVALGALSGVFGAQYFFGGPVGTWDLPVLLDSWFGTRT